MQILKEELKKMAGGSLETKLASLLFQYWIKPQTTTGQPPVELLMGWNLQTCLDSLRLNDAAEVC